MTHHKHRLCGRAAVTGLCLGGFLWMSFGALAGDNAALVSISITNGTTVWPRSMFTQTWTVENTGTTTWEPTQDDYTFNLISWDTLGAIPTFTNTSGSWFTPSAIIGSGKAIAPGQQATFSIIFIAPEAAGSYTDTFQLNNTSGEYFGPEFTVQVNVKSAGSTNQFDRSRAISYANNYAGFICSDGYFWTNGSDYYDYGTNVAAPTAFLGDDCAHFVSCCIGSEPHERGAGLHIPSRVSPTYGEPGAPDIVNNILLPCGYAAEVSSLSQMEPGDIIGWNWEGETNIEDLDHVSLYLGNGMTAAHSGSCLEVSANTWYQDAETDYVRHLIHIFDAPTITASHSSSGMVLTWGTNWTGYTMYSSTSLSPTATWTKMTATPTKSGALNKLSFPMGTGAVYYRLMLPYNP